MISVNQAIHFIEKLEACNSMAAKLVLLRGFCEKWAKDFPEIPDGEVVEVSQENR